MRFWRTSSQPPSESSGSPPAGPPRTSSSAIERQFEIVGEAMNRLVKLAPQTAASIPDLRAMIAFRNRLIQGYNVIDYEIAWAAVQASVPNLLATVGRLLQAPGDGTASQGRLAPPRDSEEP